MQDTTSLLIIILILISLSSFFSSTETAFSSANRIRLKNYAADGNKKAEKCLKILENFDDFLSAVLIGNNIVNIASATLATVLFTIYFKDKGPTISTIVTTIVVLIFAEIGPKSLAKKMPETIAMSSVSFVSFLMVILKPLTFLFNLIKILLNYFIKVTNDESDIADELMTMVEEAENDGNLESHESDLITAAIEFNDLEVRDVLTPRVDLIAININLPVEKIEEEFRLNSFSRLPVYDESIDNIIGVIHEKDFYSLLYSNHENPSIKSIIKSTLFTSPHVKISTLLRQLQGSKSHLAIVIDEYGGTAGIITLEDILEELVGEIWDEHDTVKEFYTKISDDTYLVNCEVELDDLFERFDIDYDDEEFDFVTVSGWVTSQFDQIPKPGASFNFENLLVTVTQSDNRKVKEIKIAVSPKINED